MALGISTFLVVLAAASAQETLFPVSIIHFNDMHARFDETNMMSNTCKASDECIGGYARLVTKVKELRIARADMNPIFLNAADNYQGTLWYNTFKWNVTSELLNFFPADATTIGNHEFDDGVEGLVPYMERSVAPILISNVDDSLEPSFQEKYNKSMVITKYGRPIGIVGVTTTFRSNWGNVNILPEVEAVREEVAKLTAEGVDIIIVLSHCGLDVDREIARHGGPIDIIVGGHSHSFLWSGPNPPGPDSPADNYPTIEENENGDSVLIVQASAYTKYLGDITLFFNDAGQIENYNGAPIFLSHDVVQDPETLEALAPWKEVVDKIQNRVVGKSKYDVPSYRCYSGECLMGSLTADAYVAAFLTIKPDGDGWTGAAVSLAVPGGVRAGLSSGEIFYGDLITTTPFENVLHSIEIQGKVILDALEFSVSNAASTITLQVSGLKVVFDMKKDAYDRVTSLHVLCRVCENNIPKYEPIDLEKYYRVVVPSFLAEGGDGFTMIAAGSRNTVIGPLDIEALTSYVEKN